MCKEVTSLKLKVHAEKYWTTQKRSAGACAKKYMLIKVGVSVLKYIKLWEVQTQLPGEYTSRKFMTI
jgi:hypothetical protein